MKKHLHISILLILVLLTGCSPKIKSSIISKQSTLPYDAEIFVFSVKDPIPEGLKSVGNISLGDTGFTIKCSYEIMIGKAKTEARKAGANIIKLTEHKLPSALGSTCHRIKAQLYFSKDIDQIKNLDSQIKEPELLDTDYALLHVYRFRGAGSLINYDLKLGDSTVCRIRNNFKTTLKIKKEGLNVIWAKTETKKELPIDVVHGKQYYLRCGIGIGAFVGRPTLEFVDYNTGRQEFESFDAKHTE